MHEKSCHFVELDIWIPGLNLAFEYHGIHEPFFINVGEQHFKDSLKSSLKEQKQRDLSRRTQCKKLGITLIEIPYWWNHKEGKDVILFIGTETLLATVLQERPELKDVIQSNLIPRVSLSENPIVFSPIEKELRYKDSGIPLT